MDTQLMLAPAPVLMPSPGCISLAGFPVELFQLPETRWYGWKIESPPNHPPAGRVYKAVLVPERRAPRHSREGDHPAYWLPLVFDHRGRNRVLAFRSGTLLAPCLVEATRRHGWDPGWTDVRDQPLNDPPTQTLNAFVYLIVHGFDPFKEV